MPQNHLEYAPSNLEFVGLKQFFKISEEWRFGLPLIPSP